MSYGHFQNTQTFINKVIIVLLEVENIPFLLFQLFHNTYSDKYVLGGNVTFQNSWDKFPRAFYQYFENELI